MITDSLLQLNIDMCPTRIELELTEKCNLKCRFCYNTQKPIVSQKAYQIIDKLAREGVLEIVLTGGEPMTHPNFLKILSKCSNLFAKVMVQTNGTFVTEDMADHLMNAKVFGVNISLHGNATIHQQLTCVEGSYDLALSGIKYLITRGVNLASNFVLTSENIESLPQTIEHLYDLGIKEITLTRFTPAGIGANNSGLAITSQQLINALSCANKKIEHYKDLRIILANSVPYCVLPNELSQYCQYCHFGCSRFYVDVIGNVLMCGMARIKIGNILEQDFKTMKSSSEIFKQHVLGADVPDKCKECNHFKTCRGGCRAAAYACTNNYCGADPYSI